MPQTEKVTVMSPFWPRALALVAIWLFGIALGNIAAVVGECIPVFNVDGVFTVRTILSFAIAGAALYVILSRRYPPTDRKWAYGAIGAITGFWLVAGALG